MLRIDFNNQRYVVNLTWLMPEDGVSLDKEIKSYSSRTQYNSGVILKSKKGVSIGFTDDKYRGELSAAAHLAQAEKNILLIEKLADSDDYWVVGIVDGLVQPMTDTVISINDLQEHLNEIYGNVSDAASKHEQQLRICCNDETIDLEKTGTELVGFVELVKGTPIRGSIKVGPLRASKIDIKRVALIGLASFLGYMVYDTYIKEDSLPPPVLIQPTESASQESVETIFTRDMNNLLRFYSASYQLGVAEYVEANSKKYIKGWALTELRIESADTYSLVYTRNRHTTVKALLGRISNYKDYLVTDTGDKVTLTYVIDRKANVSTEYSYEQFRAVKNQYVGILSDLQDLNDSKYKVKAFHSAADSGNSLQLTSLDSFPPGNKPMNSYTWDLSAKGVWRMEALHEMVKKYQYAVISSLVINFKSDEIKINGLLFEGA